jgi:hypothetical protein
MSKPAILQDKLITLLKGGACTRRLLIERSGSPAGSVDIALGLLLKKGRIETIAKGIWRIAEKTSAVVKQKVRVEGTPLLKYPQGERPIDRSLYHWK